MRKLLLSAVLVSLALGLAGCDDAKNKRQTVRLRQKATRQKRAVR
jgi:peptide/nickel transport system substrate-binding protein